MTIPEQTSFDALARRLLASRYFTEALAAPLSDSDQTVQSMADTSPTKWHRAHTTWFYEAFVLGPNVAGYQAFNEHYNYLFNSYYEAIGDRYPRANRGMVTRPSSSQVGDYRQAVDNALETLLRRGDREKLAAVASLVELGIHHEQQHQELLLMDIKHGLTHNVFDTAYYPRAHQAAESPGAIGWRSIDGGIVEVGFDPAAATEPWNGSSFHFDNEGPRHEVLLQPFELADRLVTCGEWLDFINDGGYQEPRLWLSDGWYTRQAQNWVAPEYWSQSGPDGPWQIHTLLGARAVDPNEPVCHLSFYEVDAYATWAGARLPTEFEWERASAEPHRDGAFLQPHHPEGISVLDASALHPQSAGPPNGELRQLFGDCWEWTASPYRPYPRYQTPDGAIGEYNGKFMINTMVLRGGSAFTPPGHHRLTYRNFFHPHTRWHLSGVRLARD